MTEPVVNRAIKRRTSRRGLIETSLGASVAAAMAPIVGGRTAAMSAGMATPIAGADLDALFAELDDFIAQRMAELQIPGVAVGVIVGDREHAKGFGVTSIDHPLPVATETLFQIGSTTKTYTGTALMRLIEQGTLDLEAPVRTYLPDFRVADPAVSREVRLRHLVTHTAGWYDRAFVETGDGDDALARFVAGMADLPQVTPLGKYFSYNNSAVCVAGRVIEAVTEQTYEAAVRDLVVQPLGLPRASFFAEEIMTEAFVVGHGALPDDPQGAPVVLEPWALPRSVNPAGGLIASVDDELRYARFHLGDGTANGTRLLSAESLQRMRTPLGPGGSTPFLVVDRVGVNWMLQWRDGEQIVSHLGGSTGQLSDFTLVPERDFAVTILTNANAGAVLVVEATNWALERFLGLRPPAMTPIPLSAARRAEYIGDYILPVDGGVIEIREKDGALHLELFASGQTAPEIASALRFIGNDLALHDYMGVPVYTDFIRDDAGNVAWIRFLGRMTPRG
jgi:CubicO group peptidase (beta-lactamase class C family)